MEAPASTSKKEPMTFCMAGFPCDTSEYMLPVRKYAQSTNGPKTMPKQTPIYDRIQTTENHNSIKSIYMGENMTASVSD